MTCSSILSVSTNGWFSMAYQLPCKKPVDGHRGPHEPDLSKLPLTFEGRKGTWVARIKLR